MREILYMVHLLATFLLRDCPDTTALGLRYTPGMLPKEPCEEKGQPPSNGDPTIAVVIPVYKGARFIEAALDSVMGQSLLPSEVIVIDDGSPDESGAIAASYGERVRVIRQQNRGMAGARNAGVRFARSTWIAFLDQDDICEFDRLKKTREAILAAPSAKWVYSDYTLLDATTQTRTYITTPDPTTFAKEVRYHCHLMPSYCSIRRDALIEIGGFNEKPDLVGADDHELVLRFMQKHGPSAFAKVPESLCLYAQHESNYSRRVWDVYRGRIALLSSQLNGLTGVKRQVWKRMLMARLHFDMAVMLREQQDERYFDQAIRSFMQWPFVHRMLPVQRYKVLSHMFLTRLKILARTP